MTYHPVLDAEELRRALDVASIEDIICALVRKGQRAVELAQAALHDANHEAEPGRVRELAVRCADSARLCRNYTDAVHVLAPYSDMQCVLEGYSRSAATLDRLAQLRLDQVRCARPVGHA